ncbi:hypothetical protein LguiA_011183 [Lonicera macranthoides]
MVANESQLRLERAEQVIVIIEVVAGVSRLGQIEKVLKLITSIYALGCNSGSFSEGPQIRRNLVAHEELIQHENGRPIRIADYVDLMCGIIHTTKDVSLLRDKNIIDAWYVGYVMIKLWGSLME